MCSFQKPGQDFFYFHDSSTAKQVKERASSLVITVLDGNPTARQIEQEFNDYLGTSWRCTARPVNSSQFIMRFPNPKEVERACYFGKSMEMKICKATLNLSPWTATVGAKGMLHKAWVQVRNIPAEKRCEKHAAYAGSLVGVTLDIDQATLHKPEYCRILIGCRDVEELPDMAEGVLGDYFYDFSYEVETVVTRGPPATRTGVSVGNSDIPPSPKRPRIDNVITENSAASSAGQTMTVSQSVGTNYGKSYSQVLPTVSEQEVEEESEEDDELLIDKIAKENLDKFPENIPPGEGKETEEQTVVQRSPSQMQVIAVQAPITPAVEKEILSLDVSAKQIVPSYAAVVSGTSWNFEPIVTEMDDEQYASPSVNNEYFVQSPGSGQAYAEVPGEKLVPPADSGRFNLRNQEGNMENVMDKVAAISKKRNLEERFNIVAGAKIKQDVWCT